MADPHPLIAELARIRAARDLTLREVGGRFLRDRRELWNWERGTRVPTLPTAAAWAGALGRRLVLTDLSAVSDAELCQILTRATAELVRRTLDGNRG